MDNRYAELMDLLGEKPKKKDDAERFKVPWSKVVTKEDYLAGNYTLDAKNEAYLLIVDNASRMFVHAAKVETLDAIKEKGIVPAVGSKAEDSDFGKGVYATSVAAGNLFFSDKNAGAVCFQTHGQDYYICAGYVDGEAPLGHVFFKDAIPPEDITDIFYSIQDYKAYQKTQQATGEEALYLAGRGSNDEGVKVPQWS